MSVLPFLSRALTPPATWSELLGSQWSPVVCYTLFFGIIFLTGLLLARWAASVSWKEAGLVGSCSMSSIHAALCCLAAWEQIGELSHLRLDSKNTPYQVREI